MGSGPSSAAHCCSCTNHMSTLCLHFFIRQMGTLTLARSTSQGCSRVNELLQVNWSSDWSLVHGKSHTSGGCHFFFFFIMRCSLMKERVFSTETLVFTSGTETWVVSPSYSSLGRQESTSPQLCLGRSQMEKAGVTVWPQPSVVDAGPRAGGGGEVCIPGGSCRDVAWCPEPTCECVSTLGVVA